MADRWLIKFYFIHRLYYINLRYQPQFVNLVHQFHTIIKMPSKFDSFPPRCLAWKTVSYHIVFHPPEGLNQKVWKPQACFISAGRSIGMRRKISWLTGGTQSGCFSDDIVCRQLTYKFQGINGGLKGFNLEHTQGIRGIICFPGRVNCNITHFSLILMCCIICSFWHYCEIEKVVCLNEIRQLSRLPFPLNCS